MNVDSHLHVWDLAKAEYPWLGPEPSPVNRSFSFNEIAPTLLDLGVHAVVLVQAADNIEDTQLMLDTAIAHPEVAAVVAWVPLDDPDELATELDALRASPVVRGIRNLFHTRPAAWATSPAVDAGFGAVVAADLALDFVTSSPFALGDLPGIGVRHPDLRLVVDHLGKPPIGGDEESRREWRALLSAAAANPRTHAKLSGLYSTVGEMGSWTEDGIRPFVDDALDMFGPDRLMYGSDWPISLLAGGYRGVWEAIASILSELSAAEREAILGGTARRFYRIESPIA